MVQFSDLVTGTNVQSKKKRHTGSKRRCSGRVEVLKLQQLGKIKHEQFGYEIKMTEEKQHIGWIGFLGKDSDQIDRPCYHFGEIRHRIAERHE